MLTERALRRWVGEVRSGRRSSSDLLNELRRLPFENLGFARLDTHRALRKGVPEIIFGPGKHPEQLVRIVRRFEAMGQLAAITRLEPSVFERIAPELPRLRYVPVARIAFAAPPGTRRLRGCVPVVSGGTSDLAVAEEAAVMLELLGSRAVRVYDVGVAGVHRLLERWELLRRGRAIVVAAGMEGALPSEVGGLVRCPVIAVPTSVGYGASFAAIAPLLTMLNSCAPGVGVVNIDNGFGAGYLAARIARR